MAMMLNKILKKTSLFLICHVKRSIDIQRNNHLGYQMKLLNDQKRYKETLKLFDRYTTQDIQPLSSLIFTQALKACSQLGDAQRGLNIDHLIPSHLKDDTYILSSLIHLYSKIVF